ncbi:SGNH/GDSL hydrolase family protein [Leptothoe kymatousa]|uniref:SGNH hydrolase-type esterase domain-containing protein n=1 Tax=Leptothoe kymatousa TAU-MAC 1615 TaxID=2364775 RepID=A0ABS5Y4N1_9CYAN|nr:hypothetical protein [Leptothoe kymatousa]MBT9312463.1 hypothetical protein [Leptothoe kymatousa TAU-MAC 1615]
MFIPLKSFKAFRFIILDLLIFFSILGISELFLRKINPSWSIGPTTSSLTRGYSINRNSIGLRGDEISSIKEEDEFRVLVLGNSTTFGTGVPEESLYVKKLEHLLSEGASSFNESRFTVVNGGGQGGDIPSFLELLNNHLDKIQPDVVLLAFSPSMVAKSLKAKNSFPPTNDLSHNTPIGTTKNAFFRVNFRDLRQVPSKLHRLLYQTHVYPTFDSNVRKRMYALKIIEPNLRAQSGASFAYAFDDQIKEASLMGYEAFFKQLSYLEKELGKHQIPLIMVNIPSRFELSDNEKDNVESYPLNKISVTPHTHIKFMADELDIKLLDIRESFISLREEMLAGEIDYDPLYIPHDYTHLNAIGHDFLANSLYEFMLHEIF